MSALPQTKLQIPYQYFWKPTSQQVFLLPSCELPEADDEILESNQHRVAMNALIRSLKQGWSGRRDFFTGGNMFVYFSASQVRNQGYSGPDFFVVLGIDGTYSRDKWVSWEEHGRYPDVVIELLSPSTKADDLGKKKDLYEQTLKTTDYFVFDPFDKDSLQGWHLKNGRYEKLTPNNHGRLWSEKLGMWVGTWEGPIEGETHVWLRFYQPEGQLVWLPEEAARQKADAAKQEANVAKQKAEVAEQKAEIAQQQAELAQQRAAKLAEQLRLLGIDPDQIT